MNNSRIFDGRLLDDAVTEIQDVSTAAERVDCALVALRDFLWRTQKNRRIHIALQRNFRPECLARSSAMSARQSTLSTLAPARRIGRHQMVGCFGVINHRNFAA